MKSREKHLLELLSRIAELGINQQIDYNKFYLYSLITHSTAIEGSTVTEIENRLLFDEGISINGRTMTEQLMNLDLKNGYDAVIDAAAHQIDITSAFLKKLASIIMKNTGSVYHTALGDFSSANGDLRLLNVTAGSGGRSYMGFAKVPAAFEACCARLNSAYQGLPSDNIIEAYRLSFEAHYDLVTIHPWADGNGRMARLLMNYIQFAKGIIPSKVDRSRKVEYIKSLFDSQTENNSSAFIDFMFDEHIRNLENEVTTFIASTNDISRDKTTIKGEKKPKSREIIIELIASNPHITMRELSVKIGIGNKAVEKHIASLKADGRLIRIGADKGGYWEVIK